MYYKMMLEDKVRVPPTRLGEKLEKVLLEVLQEQLEGSIDKELGIFIAVTKVEDVGDHELRGIYQPRPYRCHAACEPDLGRIYQLR